MPTPVTFANFLFSGWGSPSSITGVSGTQRRCLIAILAGPRASVDPTFTFIYPDGTYPLAPGILARFFSGTGAAADLIYQPGCSNTVFTYMDIPQAGSTYVFCIDTLGM